MKIFKEIKILALGIISFCSTSVSAQSYESYVQCEDTCRHIHGIDLSHYQGEVFWEAVGDNSKMAYVYLKATEGGTRIDPTYKKNIELAHRAEGWFIPFLSSKGGSGSTDGKFQISM